MTVISLGGNAIVRRGQAGTAPEQFENARKACTAMSSVIATGSPLVITHGNGPAVGNLFIQNEAASAEVPPMPLYICDADSEGSLGLIIQQSVHNVLMGLCLERDVVTVLTQVVVDSKDEAFSDPTKPIGPFYGRSLALALTEQRGWVMKEDALKGFRRVVASPKPLRVVEAGVISQLSRAGVIVIAAGGGGVPVVEASDGTFTGIDAVIDKDLATALLAAEVKADKIINLTAVDMVYRSFGRPDQTGLPELSVKEAVMYLEKGEFEAGSMGPKIEAAVWFIENGGGEVLITSPERAADALSGRAGTRIRR